MLNLNDFGNFILNYAQYVCGILAVFGMLWVVFTLVKRIRPDGLYVKYEENVDNFGNKLPEKKYVVYKDTTYYLSDNPLFYKIMDEDYISIDDKLIKIHY